MITYNHELYIKEAIEGVLMQQGKFIIELIIANDCSTDKSDQIIRDIIDSDVRAKEVKYISHKKNIGMQNNFISAFNLCDGKYIALCEGDDYWTDPFKLQKQVDFLEGNEEFVMCYHDVSIINSEGLKLKESKTPDIYKRSFSSLEIIKCEIFLCTMSLVFRNVIKTLPEEFLKAKNGDSFLTSFLGQYGKGKYMENIGGMYRVHDGGIWSSSNDQLKMESKKITFYQLHKYYESIHNNEISKYYLLKSKKITSNYRKNSLKSFILKLIKRSYKKIKTVING